MIVIPLAVAIVTIPNLTAVYRAAGVESLVLTAFFGMLWGAGAVAFGLGVTRVGLALGFGIILGTASYMSPEQTESLPVDKRADIWSYGVVLWEMLTGKRLFEGKSVSHTLADVLRMEIDFSTLRAPFPKKTGEGGRLVLILVQKLRCRNFRGHLRESRFERSFSPVSAENR